MLTITNNFIAYPTDSLFAKKHNYFGLEMGQINFDVHDSVSFFSLTGLDISTRLLLQVIVYCWFSHDVTKFKTSELLIRLRFYLHDV